MRGRNGMVDGFYRRKKNKINMFVFKKKPEEKADITLAKICAL